MKYVKITDRCNTLLEESQKLLADVAPKAKTHLVESEHIGEGIVAFSEKNKMDLLVVGETPRNELSRFLMGSTTRYVLRHAPCSVWVTRNRLTRTDEKTTAREHSTIV